LGLEIIVRNRREDLTGELNSNARAYSDYCSDRLTARKEVDEMFVYRSTKDTPDEVRAHGLRPWLATQGRWSTRQATQMLREYFNQGKTPLEFSRYIIDSTKGDTVSTSKDRHCAGQGIQRGGNIYKIFVDEHLIHSVPWTQEILGTKSPIRGANLGLNPTLYLNVGCSSPLSASIILIVHKGEERTFLTDIPPQWVKTYKLHHEVLDEAQWHELWPRTQGSPPIIPSRIGRTSLKGSK
jgi:hypothetical protein